jgi:catalase-peroxidase
MSNQAKCPFPHAASQNATAAAPSNAHWWPKQLKLGILHQHAPASNPMGATLTTQQNSKSLDLDAVVQDLHALMTDSQDWWPADWGHYGGLMVRMAWHAAGTYRVTDGRGGAGTGNQRLPRSTAGPTTATWTRHAACSGPSNKSTAASSRGRICSFWRAMWRWSRWALKPLALPVAAKTFGSPSKTFTGVPKKPGWPMSATAASASWKARSPPCRMGLIYVNPEGPNGKPDPVASGRDVRETFARMAMNDEETVALVAGGHTFGKAHGAGDPALVGPEPEGAPIEAQGLWLDQPARHGQRRAHHHQRH